MKRPSSKPETSAPRREASHCEPERLKFRQLCRAAGVAPRSLRYALDLGFVPAKAFGPDDIPRAGRGVRHEFVVWNAYLVAMGAKLLEAGVRSPVATKLGASLLQWIDAASCGGGSSLGLSLLVLCAPNLRVQVGDATVFRVLVKGHCHFIRRDIPAVGPWTDIDKGEPVLGFTPVVVLELNLGELLARLLKHYPNVVKGIEEIVRHYLPDPESSRQR